jgi:hypothetical protein
VRPSAATHPAARDLEHWPSSVEASTLLLSLEALARWREHLAMAMEDASYESWTPLERPDQAASHLARRGLH